MPMLTLKFKKNTIADYPLQKGKSVTIGRRTNNDIVVENLSVENARRVFQVRGFERDPIRDLTLRDVAIASAAEIGIVENVTNFVTHNVTINGNRYEFP